MAKNRKLPQHLLVLRISAMGDVAMLPHALRALRAAYPDLRITVATQRPFFPFFEGLGVDFLAIDPKGRQHSLWGMLRMIAAVRRMGIDAVADIHDVIRSAAFRHLIWLCGIPTAHIDKGHLLKHRFIRHGAAASVPLRHSVLRYCDVFRRLGFVFDDPAPAARTDRPNPLGPKTGRWVGFAPFSAQQSKAYPVDLAREAVRLLAARCDRLFIHSGGGSEAAFACEMEAAHPNVTALHGRMALADEMNLIAYIDCLVSMDSLAMHLAALVATPVISVWGATHPGLGFLGWGCDPRNILQADMPCRPCSVYGAKPCRFGDRRCLRAVTPQAIADKVEEVLNNE